MSTWRGPDHVRCPGFSRTDRGSVDGRGNARLHWFLVDPGTGDSRCPAAPSFLLGRDLARVPPEALSGRARL